MKKEERIALWVVSILSLILAAAGLATNVLRSEPIQGDFAGLLVGILSVLVTLLIGWQIYRSVSIDKELEKTLNRKISEISHTQFLAANMIELSLLKSLIACGIKYSQWYSVIMMSQLSVLHIVNCGKKEQADKFIEQLYTLSQHIEEFDSIELKEYKELVDESRQLAVLTDRCFDFYSHSVNLMSKIQSL